MKKGGLRRFSAKGKGRGVQFVEKKRGEKESGAGGATDMKQLTVNPIKN